MTNIRVWLPIQVCSVRALLFSGLLLLSFISASTYAACSVTIGSITATSTSVAVGSTTQVSIPISYSGCQSTAIKISDNAPGKLTYSSCSTAGSNWNCSSVSTVSGVTSSTFTPGNNGNRSDTLAFTYTAASAGSQMLALTNSVSSSSNSITITVTSASAPATLIAQYHFEDAGGYAHITGELTDSAGATGGPYNGTGDKISSKGAGNYPGQTSSSPAISGDPGTCKYCVLLRELFLCIRVRCIDECRSNHECRLLDEGDRSHHSPKGHFLRKWQIWA